jgi:hypothetical protein
MMRMPNLTSSLVDQDRSVVPGGAAYLNDIERRLAPYFERTEPRQRAMAWVRGLLSPAERKNSWQLAEVSGDTTPYAFQHLRRRALWDPEAVCAELRHDVIQHLGDPEAVLVLDETGLLKNGRQSAGVARQYRGTAGRIENGQIGVFLGYASRLGHALLDRELYLPKAWTDAPARCQQAGIPANRRFATKPQLAQPMLQRAPAAGVPGRWVTGDRGWKPSPGRMCWRSRAKHMSGWAGDNARSKPSWPRCRRTAGPDGALVMVPKVHAGITGSGCRWPIPWPRHGAAGCWCGVA